MFSSSGNRSSKTAIFNYKSKQIKKAYNIHSSFLAKHHIDGIVAMFEVSDVDNVCVCLKRSGQFALKRAFSDGSPHHMPSALQGLFGFAEGLVI